MAVGEVACHGGVDEDCGIVELTKREGLPEIVAAYAVLVGQELFAETLAVWRCIHDVAPDGPSGFWSVLVRIHHSPQQGGTIEHAGIVEGLLELECADGSRPHATRLGLVVDGLHQLPKAAEFIAFSLRISAKHHASHHEFCKTDTGLFLRELGYVWIGWSWGGSIWPVGLIVVTLATCNHRQAK